MCRNIPKPVSYTIKQRNRGNGIYGGFQRRDRATTVPVPSFLFVLPLELTSGTLAVHKVVNLIPTSVENSVMPCLHVNSTLHGNPANVDPKQASFFITEPSNVESRRMFPSEIVKQHSINTHQGDSYPSERLPSVYERGSVARTEHVPSGATLNTFGV